MAELLPFPENFLWGVSTAAHQVEGNTDNDWSVWERCNAERLARGANPTKDYGNGPLGELFDPAAHEAEDPSNYISGRGVEFKRYWQEDFDTARTMGMNAIRFSVEWSRIEPSPGQFDTDAMRTYHRMVTYAHEIGLKPFITLHHFTSPTWFSQGGGFESQDSVNVFCRYVEQAVPQISAAADEAWLVINEPETYTGQGWLFGDWPPNKRNPLALWKVHKRLADAHKYGYDAIKNVDETAQVSSAVNNIHFDPKHNILYPWNKAVAAVGDKLINHNFHEATMSHQDFIGLNQYQHCVIDGGIFRNESGQPRSDLGWYLNPASLYETVKGLMKYEKPIIITEHGLADRSDRVRQWYLTESLRMLHRSIQEGADVRGYLHWSLLDNFEWDKGYWPKFGLVEVDRTTMDRNPRPSFDIYGRIALQNALPATS